MGYPCRKLMSGYGDFVYNQGYDSGYHDGEVNGRDQDLMAIMKNSGRDLDEAMRLLDLDPEDKPHYEELLQKLHS